MAIKKTHFSATTTYDNYTLWLNVAEESYNVANNSSHVSWNLYIINGGRRFNISSFKYNVQINGVWVADFYGKCDTTDVDVSGGEHFLAEGTLTVYHESDGKKTIYCYASCGGRSNGHGPGSGACDGNFELSNIPRAPSYTDTNASNITEHSVRLTSTVNTHELAITEGGWDLSTDGGTTIQYYANDVTDKTITGLEPGTKYWYRGYVKTAGGWTNSSWKTFTTEDCVVRQKINNTWKSCVPYINKNGTWKKAIPYINKNGTWKEGIN